MKRRIALTAGGAFFLFSLSNCQAQSAAEREIASLPSKHTERLSEEPPPAAVVAAAPATGNQGGAVDARREATWDRLFSFLASSCYVDELGPSAYTSQWLRYHYPRKAMPRGAPYPREKGEAPPAAGSPRAALRARELRRRWLSAPESHVVDCTFLAEKRGCPACAAPSPQRAGIDSSYVAYLPAALFREPERVRAALLLVPGGNGERSRAFLTPVPGKSIYDKGSGGLETRRLVDEHLAAHPDAEPLIVLALQSSGDEHVNGSVEHLTHDVPRHIGDALLGGADPAAIALGAEGVSSGARAIVRALHARPGAFRTVGLSCLACGGVDPREQVLATRAELEAWSRALGEQVRAGRLRVRLAIGERDNQLECSRELYAMWAAAGVFDASRPAERVDCQVDDQAAAARWPPLGRGAPYPQPSGQSCDTSLDGFKIYARELHDYRFLARSYPEQLAFHLGALTGAPASAR